MRMRCRTIPLDNPPPVHVGRQARRYTYIASVLKLFPVVLAFGRIVVGLMAEVLAKWMWYR